MRERRGGGKSWSEVVAIFLRALASHLCARALSLSHTLFLPTALTRSVIYATRPRWCPTSTSRSAWCRKKHFQCSTVVTTAVTAGVLYRTISQKRRCLFRNLGFESRCAYATRAAMPSSFPRKTPQSGSSSCTSSSLPRRRHRSLRSRRRSRHGDARRGRRMLRCAVRQQKFRAKGSAARREEAASAGGVVTCKSRRILPQCVVQP